MRSTPRHSSPPRQGQTQGRHGAQSAEGDRARPRLPHERDESSDSQDQDVRHVIHQAHDDVVKGSQDTDRKPVMERAYEQQKGSGAKGTAAASPDLSGAGAGRAGGPRKAR